MKGEELVGAVARMDEHIKLTNGIREKIIKRLDYIEKLVWIIVAVTLGDLALNII